jgi:hypothetical protein
MLLIAGTVAPLLGRAASYFPPLQKATPWRRKVSRISASIRVNHNKSVQEVAEIVHLPKNTVKTRMFYARKR